MFEGKILFLRREDLSETNKDKKLEDISILDFVVKGKFGESPMRTTQMADFVLFVDDDGRERIFKSRLGKDNVIF